jgi:predicted ATPase with chaperone activity
MAGSGVQYGGGARSRSAGGERDDLGHGCLLGQSRTRPAVASSRRVRLSVDVRDSLDQRLAWSIADLGGRERPDRTDVDEAVQLRSRWVAA